MISSTTIYREDGRVAKPRGKVAQTPRGIATEKAWAGRCSRAQRSGLSTAATATTRSEAVGSEGGYRRWRDTRGREKRGHLAQVICRIVPKATYSTSSHSTRTQTGQRTGRCAPLPTRCCPLVMQWTNRIQFSIFSCENEVYNTLKCNCWGNRLKRANEKTPSI